MWSLVGTLDGQIASGPLISNEQFSAGGADSVRGYLEAERPGDDAVRGSLELRTPQLLNYPGFEDSWAFVFGDMAQLHTLDALPGQDANFTLASVGLGFKFKARGFDVSIAGSRILKDGYLTQAGDYRAVLGFRYTY